MKGNKYGRKHSTQTLIKYDTISHRLVTKIITHHNWQNKHSTQAVKYDTISNKPITDNNSWHSKHNYNNK